jgi:hypothetical protein
MNKTAKLIRYVAKHPDATAKEVAKATGSTISSVHTLRYRYKNEIAAMRRELAEDTQEQLALDLSEYPIIKEHIPTEEIEKLLEKPQSVDALVDERAGAYGKFKDLAEVSQRFKDSLQYFLITRNKYLAPDQQEALDMIFHKVARIINGDADYVDSWKDVAGYATLIADRLEGNAR